MQLAANESIQIRNTRQLDFPTNDCNDLFNQCSSQLHLCSVYPELNGRTNFPVRELVIGVAFI